MAEPIEHEHPIAVVATDGKVYLSLMDSGPEHEGAIDPISSVGRKAWTRDLREHESAP